MKAMGDIDVLEMEAQVRRAQTEWCVRRGTQSRTEYSLLLALIVLAAAGIFSSVNGSLTTAWTKIVGALSAASANF
jgi:Flp pilus assembly pilin Flp